jgi:hypothetical protein
VSDDVAEPDTAALTAEVVESEGIRQNCAACINEEGPHREPDGKMRPGHSPFNGKGRPPGSLTSTKPASEAMRRAAPKAVAALIKALDSPNQWLAITAARALLERTIPPVTDKDRDGDGPALVFPPGTSIAIAVPGLNPMTTVPPEPRAAITATSAVREAEPDA